MGSPTVRLIGVKIICSRCGKEYHETYYEDGDVVIEGCCNPSIEEFNSVWGLEGFVSYDDIKEYHLKTWYEEEAKKIIISSCEEGLGDIEEYAKTVDDMYEIIKTNHNLSIVLKSKLEITTPVYLNGKCINIKIGNGKIEII